MRIATAIAMFYLPVNLVMVRSPYDNFRYKSREGDQYKCRGSSFFAYLSDCWSHSIVPAARTSSSPRVFPFLVPSSRLVL